MAIPADTLPRCDCLNVCCDDARVFKGLARKCEAFDRLRREERRRAAGSELLRELRNLANVEIIGNGLANIIRVYPDKADAAKSLINLVHAAGGDD